MPLADRKHLHIPHKDYLLREFGKRSKSGLFLRGRDTRARDNETNEQGGGVSESAARLEHENYVEIERWANGLDFKNDFAVHFPGQLTPITGPLLPTSRDTFTQIMGTLEVPGTTDTVVRFEHSISGVLGTMTFGSGDSFARGTVRITTGDLEWVMFRLLTVGTGAIGLTTRAT